MHVSNGCLCFIITFQNTLLLNSKTEIIQARLQPLDALLSSDALQLSDATDTLPPKTPPQTPRELAHLLNTPNKRMDSLQEHNQHKANSNFHRPLRSSL